MADTDIFFSYSVLPALSLEGVIYSDIVKGSYNGEKFVRFVDELTSVMNPYCQDTDFSKKYELGLEEKSLRMFPRIR